MDANLIDQIYESAFSPDAWPAVIEKLTGLIDAPQGALLIFGSGETRWASVRGGELGVAQTVAGGWLQRGLFLSRVRAMCRTSGFFTEHDAFTAEELGEEPLWRDFFRPQGFGWGAGTSLMLPTGELAFLSLNRRYERGPVEADLVEKVDAYRPHLARAILISARLQLERAQAASEALASLGLPALVLDQRGKVLAANSLIERLADFLLWRALDHVSLTDRSANQLLHDAISAIDATQSSVRSFPVRHAESGETMVAHVIPIRLSARDVFLRCAAALVLTPVTAPQAPPVELVQSLFDLTPAEAQVARGLAAGETVDSLASARGVSENTIRMQVRGVLEKTGCGRQTDVVALLNGVSSVRLRNES